MPSNEVNKQNSITLSNFLARLFTLLKRNWSVKLLSILLAIFLWGALISEDATLTRQKTFSNVPINILHQDTLLKNGLIVTRGLSELPSIKFTAEVPQKIFDSVNAGNYNIRLDLSKIKTAGVQTIPITYSSSSLYGNVSSISLSEIEVEVDEYITRRRIPVQVNVSGAAPQGYFASPALVEPPLVSVSGPKSIVKNIARCDVMHDTSALVSAARTQYTAAPFALFDYNNKEIDKSLVTVTNESVILDTMLVEQTLYLYRPIPVNLTGLTNGRPKTGFKIKSIKAEPETLDVAASEDVLSALKLIDLESKIDISGASDTIVRSIKIKKPHDVYYINQSLVYITVEIEAETP